MAKSKCLPALVGLLGAIALLAPTAAGADTTPTIGPGCDGRWIATFNHFSGHAGASGDPEASAGPGYFLKQGEAAAAVHNVREVFCP